MIVRSRVIFSLLKDARVSGRRDFILPAIVAFFLSVSSDSVRAQDSSQESQSDPGTQMQEQGNAIPAVEEQAGVGGVNQSFEELIVPTDPFFSALPRIEVPEDLTGSGGRDINAELPPEDPSYDPTRLTLSGLVWSLTAQPKAIVNDFVVSAGDIVEEVEVIEINEQGIRFRSKPPYKIQEFFIDRTSALSVEGAVTVAVPVDPPAASDQSKKVSSGQSADKIPHGYPPGVALPSVPSGLPVPGGAPQGSSPAAVLQEVQTENSSPGVAADVMQTKPAS